MFSTGLAGFLNLVIWLSWNHNTLDTLILASQKFHTFEFIR